MEKLICLNSSTIDQEHICCAISDKKCKESYELKKAWLKQEFENDYVFRRIDARAKVFMEYGPSELAWSPIVASDYLFINCFWVSGKYKGNGYGKELLQLAMQDATQKKKKGLLTIAGKKKFPFMSDTKWLLKQGFEIIEETADGFCLLAKCLTEEDVEAKFATSVYDEELIPKEGIFVYYSNRCPFSEYHVQNSLRETAGKRNLPLQIHKFTTCEQAQQSACPATIFSLYYKGKFITTDISICMDSRFDKILEKASKK